MIRTRFSVVMMRTVLELQGTPCIPMEEERIGRDQLIFSRSFATPITTAAGMRQVLSVYGQQASARTARQSPHRLRRHLPLQPERHFLPFRLHPAADAHRRSRPT